MLTNKEQLYQCFCHFDICSSSKTLKPKKLRGGGGQFDPPTPRLEVSTVKLRGDSVNTSFFDLKKRLL